MYDVKNIRVYLASPWFNDEQAEREDRIKKKLKELGFDVWSPKDNCVCSPIADEKTRKKVFSDNCCNINLADVVFAITDGKDMGTIWEAGYAYGLNVSRHENPIKIVYYCETLGQNGQFNLMLAQSGDIVIMKYEELDRLPELIKKGKRLAYAGIVE